MGFRDSGVLHGPIRGFRAVLWLLEVVWGCFMGSTRALGTLNPKP